MTFWIGSDKPGGVHVLIIGVGAYDGDGLPNLGGAAQSAFRLAKFWAGSGDNLLDGHHLGSIDVLISSSVTPQVAKPDGSYGIAQPATLANVQEAFEAWRERSARGALAILHWIGHGEVVGSGSAPTHTLYCADLDGKGKRRAIDWNKTAFAIHHEMEDRALCFIDACRTEASKDQNPPNYPSALQSEVNSSKPKSAILYSADEGDESFCTRDWNGEDDSHGDEGRGTFRGGALFSEALLWALDGYAAVTTTSKGAAVYEDRLMSTLQDRFEVWRLTHKDELEEATFKPTPAIPRTWFNRAIIHAPKPASSVRLTIADKAVHPAGTSLRVDHANDDHRQKAAGTKQVAREWRVDLPHARAWKATAHCAVGSGSTPRAFFDEFDTVHPVLDIEMEEIAMEEVGLQ